MNLQKNPKKTKTQLLESKIEGKSQPTFFGLKGNKFLG
jgi:hypothetical protein